MPLFFIESEVKELIEKTKRLETITAFLLEHAGLDDPTQPAPVPEAVAEPIEEIEIDQDSVIWNDLGVFFKAMFAYQCPCGTEAWADIPVKRGTADGLYYSFRDAACGKTVKAQIWQDKVLGKARKLAAESGESEQLILTKLRAAEIFDR
jgi:hypothetical protein